MKRIAVAMLAFAISSGAHAQVAVGTWVIRESPKISMVVEPLGSGFTITHHIIGGDGKAVTMTLRTPLDGSETPFLIGGKRIEHWDKQ